MSRQHSSMVVVGLCAAGAIALVAEPSVAGQGTRLPVLPSSAVAKWAQMASVGHCDTLNGPVVGAARKALASGNVNLVLIWVQPKDEPEIRRAFEEALGVRKLGSQAKAMADRHFFETLVRVHRAGEGAPFTGLKPAGSELEPAVVAADRALATGSADALVKALAREIEEGVRKHFREVMGAKHYGTNDLKAGRRYVAAYVEYVHYAERIGAAASSSAHGHYSEHVAE